MKNSPETEYKKYRNALKEIAASSTGKSFLEHLKRAYVAGSALHADSHVTSYLLGQKELVMTILEDSTTDYVEPAINDLNDYE